MTEINRMLAAGLTYPKRFFQTDSDNWFVAPPVDPAVWPDPAATAARFAPRPFRLNVRVTPESRAASDLPRREPRARVWHERETAGLAWRVEVVGDTVVLDVMFVPDGAVIDNVIGRILRREAGWGRLRRGRYVEESRRWREVSPEVRELRVVLTAEGM